MIISIGKRNTISFLVTLALLFAVIFGGLGFMLMDHSSMETCPIGVMADNDCTSVFNEAIFAFHHIEAFEQLTQATVSSSILSLILLLLAGIAFITQPFSKLLEHIPNKGVYIPKRDFETPFIPPQLLRWLALHNKRGIDSDISVVGL